ncbi:MAG: 3-deoxy-manno-octulosonate cytidylyltransferase [Phycisphaerae bacterium]|nr:3-deoxy-manno-octulosonate cytidylyltransferase [Phycisphaerae bacterium]
MNAIAVIPARYTSTRLPGKALLSETGTPLICHVIEAVRPARCVQRVVVATDDERIAAAARGGGAEALLTSGRCRSGSDRVAEVADALALSDETILVNIQADEPEMPSDCVDRVVHVLAGTTAPIATLATPMSAIDAPRPDMTKVVVDRHGMALYFSRAMIPHDRDGDAEPPYLLHHGIYAYRAGFLRAYAALESTPAEQAEKLEQLRALEHGHDIAVAVVDYRGARIDTPEQYRAFVQRVRGA